MVGSRQLLLFMLSINCISSTTNYVIRTHSSGKQVRLFVSYLFKYLFKSKFNKVNTSSGMLQLICTVLKFDFVVTPLFFYSCTNTLL